MLFQIGRITIMFGTLFVGLIYIVFLFKIGRINIMIGVLFAGLICFVCYFR